MPVPELFRPFIEPIESLGLAYCITGSVAASVYGEPRLTADIDMVILLRPGDLEPLRQAFPESEYYVPPDETLRAALGRGAGGMFNLIHHRSQFKADLYLAGEDPLHAWALAHRRRLVLGDDEVWVAPPEYVVLRKLQWLREGGSDKHLRDVRFVVAATALDESFIAQQARQLGLEDLWQRCRRIDTSGEGR